MRTPDADLSFETLDGLRASKTSVPAGPIAVLLCESDVHASACVRRLATLGAAAIILVGETSPMPTASCPVIKIAEQPTPDTAHRMLNTLIDTFPGRWLLWHWNAEFFFFPFSETRSLADLTAFLSDERRRSIYTYALDLYAPELPPGDVDPWGSELWFDAAGYHAFPEGNQQLTVYGGLGWRFQEISPQGMAQIGRTSLFKAEKGVHLDPNMLFDEAEWMSVSCRWHHNPTAAVMTLRRARRVQAHPHFGPLRDKLLWRGSTPFGWALIPTAGTRDDRAGAMVLS